MKCPFCKKDFNSSVDLPRQGLIRCPHCHQAFQPDWSVDIGKSPDKDPNNIKNRLHRNS